MTQRPLPSLPDPDRFGGPGWLARSGGVMSGSECARGLAIASRQQVQNLWQRIVPFLHRPGRVDDLPPVPDSKLVKLVEKEDPRPEYLKFNPERVVLAMIDDGKTILATTTLLEYLDTT